MEYVNGGEYAGSVDAAQSYVEGLRSLIAEGALDEGRSTWLRTELGALVLDLEEDDAGESGSEAAEPEAIGRLPDFWSAHTPGGDAAMMKIIKDDTLIVGAKLVRLDPELIQVFNAELAGEGILRPAAELEDIDGERSLREILNAAAHRIVMAPVTAEGQRFGLLPERVGITDDRGQEHPEGYLVPLRLDELEPTGEMAGLLMNHDGLQIPLERTLQLMYSDTAHAMQAYYIRGEDAESIAARTGKSTDTVHHALQNGRRLLTALLPQVAEGTIAYEDWSNQPKHPQNVLTLMSRTGIPIGGEDTLEELRERAVEIVAEACGDNALMRRIVTDYYGLEDPSAQRSLQDLANAGKITHAAVQWQARQAVGLIAAHQQRTGQWKRAGGFEPTRYDLPMRRIFATPEPE